jgi:UDP-N-acetylglucosamine--N-acetylmuramyl-(pentapeptide) pyrophosphoryl-undecaprenol N-acetylglucosamine transferase
MSQKKTRIMFAGGGTGGHLYPALAVAALLKKREQVTSIEFIGASQGIETRLVPEAGYALRTLPLSGIKGASLTGKLRAAAFAALAVLYCCNWMISARPALVIGVGGYASGPAVLAARLLLVRTMIMEQNHFPGATNRWLARFVNRVCVPSEAARARLGNRGEITGNPVRAAFTTIGEPPLGERLSLLVFGGSRGARSINLAMAGALSTLAALPTPPRIVHQTGEADAEKLQAAYRADYPEDLVTCIPYLPNMPRRLAEADLVVCRAGATTLAELAAAGRTALLVPFPYAADDHQRLNAESLVEAGAARMVRDRDLNPGTITALVQEMIADRETLKKMGHASRAMAIPDAARRIATMAEELMTGKVGVHVS